MSKKSPAPTSDTLLLVAELERLRAENTALKANQGKQFRLAVSTKGAVSVYGIRRFPITLYRDEWDTILGRGPEIADFITVNEGSLRAKGETK